MNFATELTRPFHSKCQQSHSSKKHCITKKYHVDCCITKKIVTFYYKRFSKQSLKSIFDWLNALALVSMRAPQSKHVFENPPNDSSRVFSQKETTSGNSISQDLNGPKFIAAAIAVISKRNELFHIQIP